MELCLGKRDRKSLTIFLLWPADMIRVGPLRRIDRALLGHSLHSTARNKSGAAYELEEMLRQATSPAERSALQAELAQARPCSA